jgi:hypothetical protein
VEFVLPSDQPLARGGLQDLQLTLVAGRPDVLVHLTWRGDLWKGSWKRDAIQGVGIVLGFQC